MTFNVIYLLLFCFNSDSVDSLNYKFEDNSLINVTNTTCGSSKAKLSTDITGSNNCSSHSAPQFGINPTDVTKDFDHYDKLISFDNWADLQTEDFLHGLSKSARNKQENIFEFIKTEVNYLKILTIMQKVYINVMIHDCKIEPKHIQQMFPDLERLIELHRSLLDELMERYNQSENKYIETIGDILLEIVNNSRFFRKVLSAINRSKNQKSPKNKELIKIF